MGRFGFHAHRALSLPTEITNRAAHCCLLRSVVVDGRWMADQGEGQQTLELLHAILTTGLPIKPYFCQNCKKCSAALKKKKKKTLKKNLTCRITYKRRKNLSFGIWLELLCLAFWTPPWWCHSLSPCLSSSLGAAAVPSQALIAL